MEASQETSNPLAEAGHSHSPFALSLCPFFICHSNGVSRCPLDEQMVQGVPDSSSSRMVVEQRSAMNQAPRLMATGRTLSVSAARNALTARYGTAIGSAARSVVVQFEDPIAARPSNAIDRARQSLKRA